MKVLLFFIIFFPLLVFSKENQSLVSRFVIFPMQSSKIYEEEADEAWWEIRKKITESKRFLVASKKFMQLKGVYQARETLDPADAILLGRLLDAHALISFSLKDRLLSMFVYDGFEGRILWSKDLDLHPAVKIKDQLVKASENLINDFIRKIPYQGYVIKDELIGQVVFSEKDKKLVKVYIGIDKNIIIGDRLQFFKMEIRNNKNLYQGGARYKVFAEGKIIRIDKFIATVSIERATESYNLSVESLVRVPNLLKADTYKMKVNSYLVKPNMNNIVNKEEEDEMLSVLVFIISLAGFLLLAF